VLEIKVGRHVQTVRSDRGLEFDNAAVHKLLVDRGVEQQLTVGYSPQQNGAAERAVGVVCTMGRSIHIDAGLCTMVGCSHGARMLDTESPPYCWCWHMYSV
jgi:transposase InsO family protein